MGLAQILTAIFTVVFLVVILSYYFLLLRPKRIPKTKEKFDSLTVIIPAHNEAKYIAQCIEAVLAARFKGEKEVIVVDDGSRDATASIVKQYPVTLIRREHTGKAASINLALERAKGKLVAIVDGDSYIDPDSLEEAVKLFYGPKVAAVCAVIKVKNRNSVLGFWLHIEQLYASLTRSLYAKVNVNIVAAGPLSIFRKECLKEIGGFRTKGFAEDADVAIRLIRAGYHIEYAEKSFTETNMPVTFKGFVRQRTRFAKGTVNLLKRHLKIDHSLWQIYTLPLTLFGYFQAVIMGSLTLYSLFSGYYIYFIAKGIWLNWYVVKFFIEWLTIVGVAHGFYDLLTGKAALTTIGLISITSSLLTYPLYVLAVLRYDRTFSWKHFLAISVIFPFWIMIMTIYLLHAGEWFREKQDNKWEKAV